LFTKVNLVLPTLKNNMHPFESIKKQSPQW